MIGGILSGNYAHTYNLLKLQAVFRREARTQLQMDKVNIFIQHVYINPAQRTL